MEPGETTVETAVREVLEETGFVLRPEQVSSATWRRDATYLRRRRRYLQHEVVVDSSPRGEILSEGNRLLEQGRQRLGLDQPRERMGKNSRATKR